MLLVTACPFVPIRIALPRCPSDRPVCMIPAATDQSDDAERGREQARLLAAMARGDKSALARLYDSLSGPLYSLAFRVTNNTADAQDIVQDVFLQMWHKASTYDTGRGSVFGWATTLTRNRAIDRIRLRKRRTEILAESGTDLQPAPFPGEQDSAASLWVQEKAGAVQLALAQLAPDQKQAIELAFFGGLTQAQIATQFNEPLGTIKARIRRGLLKLRETLPARL